MKLSKLYPWRLSAALGAGALALFASLNANAQLQWLDADIGGPGWAGSTTANADGTLTITGGGADIWGTASQYHYHYVWASGTQWDITAQFQAFSGPDQWSKVELLVSQSDPTVGVLGGDPFIAMMDTQPNTVTPPDGTATGVNNGGIDQFRTAANGNADWLQMGATPAPAYPNDWFWVNRNGSVFTLYKSADGATWHQYIQIDTAASNLIGQDNSTRFGTPWPTTVAVGIAVTAHNNTYTPGASATIANLSTTNIAAAIPPTLVVESKAIQPSVTNYYGSTATLTWAATNNAWPATAIVGVNYQWYYNGTAIPGATGTAHTWLLDTNDDGALLYCTATLAAPFNTITTNSATAVAGVLRNVVTYTNGAKVEICPGTSRGSFGAPTSTLVDKTMDNAGGFGNNYVSISSGWFLPPTTDNYTFFLACDDDSDLYLSTDATMANKTIIAQETAYSGLDSWLAVGGGTLSQKRSDQWIPAGGATQPWAAGIPLTAGMPYFIELVHHQGGGGDNFSVTYQTATMMADPNWTIDFTNAAPGVIGTSNLVLVTHAVTTLAWVTQPANYTASVGFGATFQAKATSDSEFPITYTWYKGNLGAGTLVATTTGTSYTTPATTSADTGSTFYVVASTANGELSITSSVVTLNVASPLLERGWAKMEYWYSPNPGFGPFMQNLTNASGTVTNYGLLNSYAPAPNYTLFEPLFEGNSKGSAPANYTSRLGAYFYPPATDDYVFFVNSDDPGDLFFSTDSNPAHAVMVAQETGWDNSWQWLAAGNGGSTPAMRRSDQWTAPDGTVPFAAGIHLTAGQQCYIAIIHRDTGGGNNCEATFKQLHTATGTPDADPLNGSYSKLSGNLIASYGPRSFNAGFTMQPTNTSVVFGGLAKFYATGWSDSKSAVGTEGDPTKEWTNSYCAYQWTVNGNPIPGATTSSYAFGPVSPYDNGSQFTCMVRGIGLVNNSLVDVWSNSTPATLTVTGQAVYESGFALHEYWSLNPGRANVENNLAGDPTWYMSTPAFEVDVSGSEVADNFTDELIGYFIPPTTGNYVFYMNSDDDADLFVSTSSSAVNRVLVAQETGWAGALQWGSTGGTAGQERSDTFTALGVKPWANGIPLTANQKYFMQAVHHQGGGGTETCVNYSLVGAATPASGSRTLIRGTQVGAFVPACTFVTVTNNPQSVTTNNYAGVSFSAGGNTDSRVPVGPETVGVNFSAWTNYMNNFLFFQWYKNGQPVAGANSSVYSIPMVLPSDAGTPVFCTMRALGYGDGHGNPAWATSSIAYINIITSAPPTLVYSAIYTNYACQNFLQYLYQPVIYLDLAFSGPMDPVALLNANNYVFAPQPGCGLTSANITSITVNSNGYRQVELALNVTPNAPFTVQVNGARALGGGLALTGSNVTNVNTVALTCLDIGLIGATIDPAVATTMYADGKGAYTVQCEGSDIWNAQDGFNFLYELKDGNFDVVVRQVDISHVSNWTKGGLMIRETLDPYSRDWNIVNDPASGDGIGAVDGTGNGANQTECNARTTYDTGSASWRQVAAPYPPAYPNAWLRLSLKRITNSVTLEVQNIITAYNSTNGVNWLQLAQTDAATNGAATPLPDPIYVGICSTAHDNDSAANIAAGNLLYVATEDYANYNSSYIATPPTLTIVNNKDGNVAVSWSPAEGTLLSSPALTGPNVDWQPVGTANPAIVPITGSAQYFRVQVAQ